jgi:hypothetical protein
MLKETAHHLCNSNGHIFLQAACSDVKGYENLRGYKLRFETTWLEK